MSFQPENITIDHVLDTVKKIEKQNITLIPSTRYLVEINGKTYPPKEIMRYAHEEMNGEHVWKYTGGEPTNKYLKRMNLKIVDMAADPIKELISMYKKHVANKGMKDELYKWELFSKNIGKPDVRAQDFYKEITSIDFGNLIYGIGAGVIRHLARERTEAYKQLYINLLDESKPLSERIKTFGAAVLPIYRELVPEERKKPHHDERTVATILSFNNPEKYALYKDSFYKKFCKMLKVKPQKTGDKYPHYLELLNGFIVDYILKDQELLDMIDSQTSAFSFRDPSRTLLAQDILYQMLDKERVDESISKEEEPKQAESSNPLLPMNTILYGPPGTGKTYRLLNEYLPMFQKTNELDSKKEMLLELAQKYAWWEIITLCMLDLETTKVDSIYHHELLQSKVSISENKTPRNTIWAWLQRHTKEECKSVNLKKRDQPLIFYKDEKSVWSIDTKLTKEVLPDLVEEFDRYKNYSPTIKNTSRFETVTFHQSYAYEDFVEGIKPELMDESDGDLRYTIEPGIFKRMCMRARKDPDNNYALFIDEINRGNVASIFGELITLIEADKREGCENAMELTLPYSKTKFSVPSNLYIIGTMNTADRSVEALDTALRRRFSFVEMEPKPELISEIGTEDIMGINLVAMLTLLNKRIEKLVDKDHMIGHSYFLNISDLAELKRVFQNKIIPLLQEYFFGDYGKIGLVLGTGFFKNEGITETDADNIFADFNGYDTNLLMEKPIYHLKDVTKMIDDEFKAAIDTLIGNAEA